DLVTLKEPPYRGAAAWNLVPTHRRNHLNQRQVRLLNRLSASSCSPKRINVDRLDYRPHQGNPDSIRAEHALEASAINLCIVPCPLRMPNDNRRPIEPLIAIVLSCKHWNSTFSRS